MLCEDIPAENSFDSGRGSQSSGARSSRGSHSEEHESGSGPHILYLSRERLSCRQASYVMEEPMQAHREYYVQGDVHVYEYLIISLWCFKKIFFNCAEFTVHLLVFVFGISEIHEMHLSVMRCSVLVPTCH